MTVIGLDDAIFLLTESAGRPNHVIALQLFEPPAGAGAEYLAELHRKPLEFDVTPLFRKYVQRRLLSPTGMAWKDGEIEIDYRVRRVGLPAPGRVRELFEAVSLQHGVMLDRNRPLWECYLYEGLADGRFAIAFKAHHALADGMSFAKHIFGGLASKPDGSWAAPWALRPDPVRVRPPKAALPDQSSAAGSGSGHGLLAPLHAVGATVNTVKTIGEMVVDSQSELPYRVPWSVLNSSLTGARRFAGDKWDYERLKAVAGDSGGPSMTSCSQCAEEPCVPTSRTSTSFPNGPWSPWFRSPCVALTRRRPTRATPLGRSSVICAPTRTTRAAGTSPSSTRPESRRNEWLRCRRAKRWQ